VGAGEGQHSEAFESLYFLFHRFSFFKDFSLGLGVFCQSSKMQKKSRIDYHDYHRPVDFSGFC